MRNNLVHLIFVIIGIFVGVIFALQIQADPPRADSFPLSQLNIQKSMLVSFSSEQEMLKRQLDEVKEKIAEAKKTIEQRSSKKTIKTLEHLKSLTGLDKISGSGVSITLNDNFNVSRLDFSSINENFVQAADIRDLVNSLFLKDAKAISINGKRVLPLTPIQPVFDSILVGNIQMTSPFIFEAAGNEEELKLAVGVLKKRKIQVFVDPKDSLNIGPSETARSVKFISLEKMQP